MAVITGTEAADTLVETPEADTIDGGAGNDTIVMNLSGSPERVDGGDGNDRLVIQRSAARIFLPAFGPGSSYSGRASTDPPGTFIEFANIENFTVYHLTGESPGDFILTGNGEDVYHFTATNNNVVNSGALNQVDLGGGTRDLLVVDASAVIDHPVTAGPTSRGHHLLSIGGAARVDYFNVDRLELIGGALGDSVTGLGGGDVIDGRGGNDSISGLAGDDRLTGGDGNDSLSGGEGNDTLVVGVGADSADGGNGSDRLEIDARAVAGSVTHSVSGGGPSYSDSLGWGDGAASAAYSGIESFTIHSNAGDHADLVTTGEGEDVFFHYGIDGAAAAVDQIDLGGGSSDLLVADFSSVSQHAVSNELLTDGDYDAFSATRLGSTSFRLKYKGVERIHFIGGSQGDSVTGLAAADILEGRGGDDVLTGAGGADDIAGGTGTNSVNAGDGDDIIRSGSLGLDTVAGGAGADTAIVDYSAQTAAVTNVAGGEVAFGNGSDTRVVLTGVERIVITTGSGNDTVATLGGNDEIRTGAGSDSLAGGGGDDYLDGGPGVDSMTGGSGHDTYVADDAADTIVEAPGGGRDQVLTSLATFVLPADVEILIAVGGTAREFRGNAGDNSLTGEAGADTLLLQDGGADSAHGRAGDDAIYFGPSWTVDDFADGGAGRDALVLQGNYTATLTGDSLRGFEAVSLQSGATTRYGDTADNSYDYAIATANGLVPAGVQLIVNGQSLRSGEDFSFDGSAETDGSFLVYAGHGIDTLKGGAGNDVFFFEGNRWGPSDRVDGGGGRDALVISAGSGLNRYEFGESAFTGIESISVSNRYATDPSQTPSYELVLHNANVAAGGTLIVNGSKLAGPAQTIGVDGSAVVGGNLQLFGGAGDDTLTGGAGNDLLLGGGGADSLSGGGGADVFRYDSTSHSSSAAADLIGDFQGGIDKVDLSRIDANAHVAGDQAFSWIGTNAFSGAAGELRTYEADGYRWVAGDTDGDGAADFAIAFQAGTAPLVQGDFLP